MDCVFCKIVKEELESVSVWEDEEHIALLDLYPNTKGMVVLITKKHYDSYAFDIPDKAYDDLMIASKTVARIMEKGLKVQRVSMVMEGMGVNHAHIKLYPMHGLEDKFHEMLAKDRVFFKKYPGYITTQMGTQVDIKELKKLAKEIKSANE
ncbi:MAG: HIT family protein [Candidatus Aenigmatarchaeota archaeon]